MCKKVHAGAPWVFGVDGVDGCVRHCTTNHDTSQISGTNKNISVTAIDIIRTKLVFSKECEYMFSQREQEKRLKKQKQKPPSSSDKPLLKFLDVKKKKHPSKPKRLHVNQK